MAIQIQNLGVSPSSGSNSNASGALSAPCIVGIDLGTTNSLVAFVREGKPEVLQAQNGERLVPSVVSLLEGSPVVGTAAKRRKVTDARQTVYSVKRLLGRSLEDLATAAAQLPYELVGAGENPASAANDSIVRIQLGERSYTAIEISAMILRELKTRAEQALQRPVTQAVITVPAYFNDSQRQATRTAGRLAGWDVLRIINEPTAASLAYGLDRRQNGLIAVYDLGGGTFDVSVLRLQDGIFEVLATSGNTSLGGDDLDQALVSVAAQELRELWDLDVSRDLRWKAALIEGAERVKIALSETETAQLLAEVDGRKYIRDWTLQEFEALVKPVLEKTRAACEQALKDAGLAREELTDVVMVGGPTRLRIVQQVASEIFGREPNTSVHPDEVVAVGAAIQADILAGNNRELLLLDVVPLSLGIETYGGLMSPLITRNTRIPTVARETFTTFVDNQTGVDIHVLQGERDRVEDNRSLARFKLKGIEPLPAGMPRVEVTFLIDADGILQVAAKDLRRGVEQAIEVRPSFGLTDAQVEQMLQSGADFADVDVAYRRWVEVKNDAEKVHRAVEKQLSDAFRLLSENEARAIEEQWQELGILLVDDGGTQSASATAGQWVESSRILREAKDALSGRTVRLAELVVKDAIERAQTKKS
jgi:molecular chaperone DnaK